jgi:hypothetical protein
MGAAAGSAAAPAASDATPNLFTLVPVDLFRAGNAVSPKLDNLRDKDIQTAEVTIGDKTVKVVKPRTGGISTFDSAARMKGKIWKIPAGVKLPATIMIIKDHYNNQMQATHYSISPAYQMPLATYLLGLQELAKSAVAMFLTAIKTGPESLNDDQKAVKK